MRKSLSVLFLGLLLTGIFVSWLTIQLGKADPSTLIVPDDYPTIQAAINAAVDGDMIFVKNGTYYENVVLNKTITLLGENKTARIDGNATGNVFTVTSENCVIRGFTIRNGAVGIFVDAYFENFNNLTVSDNTIENCSTGIDSTGDWQFGYGAHALNVTNNLIRENGVAIHCSFSGGVVCGNLIVSNDCGFDATIFDGSVDNNTFVEDAVAITYDAGIVLVRNNQIYLSANYGITISLGDYRFETLYDVSGNDFWENNCGMLLESPYPVWLGPGFVENNTFRENNCAVYIQKNENNDNGQVTAFYHNNFVNNTDQVYIENAQWSGNTWDDGYPDGGNYWSDYNGIDFYSGQYQNITGSDGFGDTPYIIASDQQDNYPFTEPLDLQLPQLPELPSAFPPVARFSYEPALPVINETITFDASGSVDIDGSVVSYQWDFGNGENLTGTNPVVTHFFDSIGSYAVVLIVTDNDGSNDTYTKIVSVGRMSSNISIMANPSAITFREELTISGAINPIRPGANVTIWYEHQDALTWDILANVTTEPNSNYSFNWLPSKTGAYKLKASWTGDEYTLAKESVIIVFNCLNISSSVSIATSSASTYLGYRMNVTGTLTDMYGNPLSDETVVLYYTFSGTTTWTPITSDKADSSGKYFATWIPPATGDFILRVEWLGNSTHSEVTNSTAISSLAYNDQYIFSVESNSTISALAFNTTDWALSFSASGPSGTTGYVRITAAKTLVPNPENIRVYLDGNQTQFSIVSVGDSWILTFEYLHSNHQVQVDFDIMRPDHTPPVANAGPEQSVNEDVQVQFDGSGSTDNVGIASYVWTFIDGNTKTLDGSAPTYTFFNPGIYTVMLNVTDTAGNWNTDTMVVTVRDITPPVADAGPNQTVNEDSLAYFNGTLSTDNVGITSYVWTFVDGTPKNLSGIIPTYTFMNPGNYTVTLNVTDTAGNWATDNVTIAVRDITPPTIESVSRSPSGDVLVRQIVIVSANITDVGSGVKNASLIYSNDNGSSWRPPYGMLYNSTSGLYEMMIPAHVYGTWIKYKIMAYDNAGNLMVEDNAGQYYCYQVVPEFPATYLILLFILTTALAITTCRKTKARTRKC